MTRPVRYVISCGLAIALITAMAVTPVQSAQTVQQKVDSLFVIASSGEIIYKDLVQPAIDSISAMGVDAVAPLIDKLNTNSARERVTINNIFKKIGRPAVPLLIEALRRPDDLAVQRVCSNLGDIRDSSAVVPLLQVSDHPSWQVRENAVDALGKIGDRQAGSTVLAAMSDSVGQVRKAAVVAAGRLDLQDGIAELVHRLGDSFYGARMSAGEVLVTMDTALVVTTLSDSIDSDNELVGDLACQVLGKFGTDLATDILFAQTQSADPDRRAHAAVALIRGDPQDHCGYRQQILEQETDRLTKLKILSAISSVENVQ